MNKQVIKTISIADLQEHLPRLPFTKIVGVDFTHRDLHISKLPHIELALVDVKTAEKARVLLRFEEITYGPQYDYQVTQNLFSEWVSTLLDAINQMGDTDEAGNRTTYAFVTHLDAPWGNPHQRTAQQASPMVFGAPADASFYSKPRSNEEIALQLVANRMMQAMGTAQTRTVANLGIHLYNSETGYPFLSLTGNLGHGVSFSAVRTEDEPGQKKFVEDLEDQGHAVAQVHIGGHKYILSTGYAFGLSAQLGEMLNIKSVEAAFVGLWGQYFEELGLKALPIEVTAVK
jgi:hypothetical protein